MRDILSLIKPRIWSFRPFGRSKKHGSVNIRNLIIGFLGISFWSGIFAVSLKVLTYFKSIEDLGTLLAFKLLSMMLITLFSLLIFSSILTSLSKFYLSKDLDLVHSMPVPGYAVFGARWIESTLDSSWMVIVFTLPVFISYGIIFSSGMGYYAVITVILFALSVIASCASALMVMLIVILLPANRIKSLFVFLGLLVFILLFLVIRLSRPERFVNPDAFSTILMYLDTLQTPASPLLPSTWAFDAMKEAMAGSFKTSIFHTGLLISFSSVLIFFTLIVSHFLYFKGFSKTQTVTTRLVFFRVSGSFRQGVFRGPTAALAVKEIKTFFRDQSQWSQIFLIGALVVIYIYNFKALPLERAPMKTVYLQNLLSFLNVGLATFVLTAITARFAFPAVSNENEAFWIVKSSPITLKTFLWVKFAIYFFPLLVLTEILIVGTNLLLQVTPFMMNLSVITILFLVPGIVSLGIGIGAAYPNFKSENPAQAATSYGGILFMIVCAGFIAAVLILEAGPIYDIFMSGIKGRQLQIVEWIWIVVSFFVAFILCILAIILPIRFGEKRLSSFLL